MRRTKEEAAQTRQALLDAALVAFSDQGYQATRLQDIAKAAGATRGAIYHHFENKADLYKTLIEEAAQEGNEVIFEAIGGGGTFTEIFRRIFVNSLRMLEKNERFRQVMALSLYKTGVSPELMALETARIENAKAGVGGIAGYMKEGIAAGELRADLDPETVARAFLALQNGAAWLWLANGRFFSLADDAPALADILLHGLAAD